MGRADGWVGFPSLLGGSSRVALEVYIVGVRRDLPLQLPLECWRGLVRGMAASPGAQRPAWWSRGGGCNKAGWLVF